MKKAIYLVLAIFILTPAFSQDGYISRNISELRDEVYWDQNKTLDSNSDKIQGSLYLNEAFKKGDLFTEGKYVYTDVDFRLNLYLDEMEYKTKGLRMVLSEPEKIDKVVVDGEVFVYIKKGIEDDASGYVKVWNEQMPYILTKMGVEFKPKDQPKPYVETKPDRWERTKDKHFVRTSETVVVKVKSVKMLIKLLGKHTSELSAFAKKEKISSNDPEELAKLIEYYHSLNSGGV